MRYHQLFAKLFCRPVLIEAATRVAFEQSLLALMAGDSMPVPVATPSAAKGDPESSQYRMENLVERVDSRTAIVHIDGALDRHLSALDMLCYDATDVNDVMNAMESLQEDRNVENVLLYFNSPGGSVAGIPEAAARVRALAESKNVFAYTDGLMCSAAYWLASQATQIFANDSASVGSIGVYLALLNNSAAMEKSGRTVETIQDGKYKTAGAPWKPLSDEERAHLQADVNEIGATFRAAITSARPQVERDTMEGQSFSGTRAAAVGLVDAVRPDLRSVLAEF
jgi:signal peptide peptidase SppA